MNENHNHHFEPSDMAVMSRILREVEKMNAGRPAHGTEPYILPVGGPFVNAVIKSALVELSVKQRYEGDYLNREEDPLLTYNGLFTRLANQKYIEAGNRIEKYKREEETYYSLRLSHEDVAGITRALKYMEKIRPYDKEPVPANLGRR